MKVLALDYGRARTGMAVSDSTGTLARPLTVVQKAGTAAGMRRAAGTGSPSNSRSWWWWACR